MQRFIREGRLRGERVGRSYRLLRADVAQFAGIPFAQPLAQPSISVTAIVDIPAVDEKGLRYWSRQFASRISGRRVDENAARVELVHDAEQAQLKLILVGTAAQIGDLLGLVRLWQDQRD